MKVNDRLTIKISGESAKDIHEQLSKYQEIFSINQCGCCKNKDLRYITRVVEDNSYYELQCQNINCRAKFAFGQKKKGGELFPKRKDKAKKYIPNDGWVIYKPGEVPDTSEE